MWVQDEKWRSRSWGWWNRPREAVWIYYGGAEPGRKVEYPAVRHRPLPLPCPEADPQREVWWGEVLEAPAASLGLPSLGRGVFLGAVGIALMVLSWIMLATPKY